MRDIREIYKIYTEAVGGVVGFTGTRAGMTEPQHQMVRNLVIELEPEEVVHGDCKGADEQFHSIIEEFNEANDDLLGTLIKINIRPGHDYKGQTPYRAYCTGHETYKSIPYWYRNKEIVQDADVMIAAPRGTETQRSGTWSTVRRAREQKKTIYIVTPEGEIHMEP